jgi:hypothetical protein
MTPNESFWAGEKGKKHAVSSVTFYMRNDLPESYIPKCLDAAEGNRIGPPKTNHAISQWID